MSYRGSTAPTSPAQSECGGNTDIVTPEAPGRVSQLQRLAAVAVAPSAPSRTSRIPQSSTQSHSRSRSSSTSFSHHMASHSGPFQTSVPALQRTQSFISLPQRIPEGHSILATNVEGPTAHNTNEDFHENFDIDEASPSEDERFAESVIRGGGYSVLFYTLCRLIHLNKDSGITFQSTPECTTPQSKLYFVPYRVLINVT